VVEKQNREEQGKEKTIERERLKEQQKTGREFGQLHQAREHLAALCWPKKKIP